MAKVFEEIMVLENPTVKRVRQGSKQRIRLEMPHSLSIEKKLIEFRGCVVKVTISRSIELPERENPVIEQIFEVAPNGVGVKELSNGNRVFTILENNYNKDQALDLAELHFDNVSFRMEQTQEELPGMGSDEELGDDE